MSEAMACGTRVIDFKRGAASVIVEHGKTGFVVDSLDEMVDVVARVHTLDPAFSRARAEQRFDAPIMARRYLEIYEAIVQARRPSPAGVNTPSAAYVGEQVAELSPTRVA